MKRYHRLKVLVKGIRELKDVLRILDEVGYAWVNGKPLWTDPTLLLTKENIEHGVILESFGRQIAVTRICESKSKLSLIDRLRLRNPKFQREVRTDKILNYVYGKPYKLLDSMRMTSSK